MLGRLVNETIGIKGYAYPWGNVLPMLEENDLNIVNLETTLTKVKKKVPKVFNFKAYPDRVKTLTLGQINIVSLANNHIRDFHDEGLLETIETLDGTSIKHVGAGKDIANARKPIIITKNNIRIGVLGYTNNEPGWLAGENKPGTNYLEVGNIKIVKKDIEKIRDNIDILVVSLHWGPNMRQRPTQEFIDFAHQLIDAGVDIIHGHSAHIFQGIEIYKKKVILYDTGDFVDDYRVDPLLRNNQSFLFRVNVSKNGPQSIKLTPILISNMQVNHAPKDEAKQILLKMKSLCAEFNTNVEIQGEQGYVKVY